MREDAAEISKSIIYAKLLLNDLIRARVLKDFGDVACVVNLLDPNEERSFALVRGAQEQGGTSVSKPRRAQKTSPSYLCP